MKPGRCTSLQRSVGCTVFAIVSQPRTALRLSTSWITGPYPLRRRASKRKSSSRHLIRSCSCQAIVTLVWTSCSPSINCSGPICSNLCGITLDGRGYPRMCDNATTKHRDWWNISTKLCRRISCMPSFLVTCWNTMSECVMSLLVICCVSLCPITKGFSRHFWLYRRTRQVDCQLLAGIWRLPWLCLSIPKSG